MDTQNTIPPQPISSTQLPEQDQIGNDVRHPKNKRWLLVAILLMLLIVLSGMGILAYQNSLLQNELTRLEEEIETVKAQETSNAKKMSPEQAEAINNTKDEDFSNWKTYSITAINTSFKYPSDYRVDVDGNSNSLVSIYSPYSPSDPDPQGRSLFEDELKIEIHFEKGSDNKNSDEYFNEEYQVQTKDKREETVEVVEVKVGDQTIKGMKSLDLPGRSETYLLVHNGYLVRINKFPGDTTRTAEFEKILSTFEFTN